MARTAVGHGHDLHLDMISSYRIVDLLGVGLPPDALSGLKGELDQYRRGPHHSGAPVGDHELVPVAVTTTLAARATARHWRHLPTLVAPGCALVSGGCAALAVHSLVMTSPFLGRPAGYLPWILLLPVFALLLVRTRHVPAGPIAAGSALLAAGSVLHLLGSAPLVAADVAMGLALLVCAGAMPVAWFPLISATRRTPIAWAELPSVVGSTPVARVGWKVFASSALALAAGEAAFVLSARGQLPVDITLGLVANMGGLVLIGLGFGATCRPAARALRRRPERLDPAA